MAAQASLPTSPTTSGTPRLAMPDFSAAMAASVVPRWRSWSKSMVVMAPATGASTFVASKRPPRPTSTTATSTPASAKIRNAAAVDTSK